MNHRNENTYPYTKNCGCGFSQNTRNDISTVSCNRAPVSPSRSCQRRNTCPQRKGTCGSDNGYLKREAPIAMVYSPLQQWKDLYDPHTALANGTIFKELDLPFYPTPCRRKECSQCQYR